MCPLSRVAPGFYAQSRGCRPQNVVNPSELPRPQRNNLHSRETHSWQGILSRAKSRESYMQIQKFSEPLRSTAVPLVLVMRCPNKNMKPNPSG